jgi:suppressor of ftsI
MGVYGVILVKPKSNEYYNPVDVEVPLTLDDILMTNGSVYPYNNDHETFALMGRYGNITFVNGKTDYNLDLNKGQIVRFFLVDTANARPYNFTIDGHKLKLVGGDSGKYEKESLVNSVIISPAERQIVEVLFDKPGDFKVLNVTPEKVYQLGMIKVSEQKSSSLPPTISVNSNSSSSFYTLKENKDIIAQIQSYKNIYQKNQIM